MDLPGFISAQEASLLRITRADQTEQHGLAAMQARGGSRQCDSMEWSIQTVQGSVTWMLPITASNVRVVAMPGLALSLLSLSHNGWGRSHAQDCELTQPLSDE